MNPGRPTRPGTHGGRFRRPVFARCSRGRKTVAGRDDLRPRRTMNSVLRGFYDFSDLWWPSLGRSFPVVTVGFRAGRPNRWQGNPPSGGHRLTTVPQLTPVMEVLLHLVRDSRRIVAHIFIPIVVDAEGNRVALGRTDVVHRSAALAPGGVDLVVQLAESGQGQAGRVAPHRPRLLARIPRDVDHEPFQFLVAERAEAKRSEVLRQFLVEEDGAVVRGFLLGLGPAPGTMQPIGARGEGPIGPVVISVGGWDHVDLEGPAFEHR